MAEPSPNEPVDRPATPRLGQKFWIEKRAGGGFTPVGNAGWACSLLLCVLVAGALIGHQDHLLSMPATIALILPASAASLGLIYFKGPRR